MPLRALRIIVVLGLAAVFGSAGACSSGTGGTCPNPPFLSSACSTCVESACKLSIQSECPNFSSCYCSCTAAGGNSEACTESCASTACQTGVLECASKSCSTACLPGLGVGPDSGSDAPSSDGQTDGSSGSGYVCFAGAGVPSDPEGMAPIGTLEVTLNGKTTTLPICPGYGRCVADSSNAMTVIGSLATGDSVSVNVYEPKTGTFPANNTTGESNGLSVTLSSSLGTIYCTDVAGASGTIDLTSFTKTTGGTLAGTFSGTVSECSPSTGGTTVGLMTGSFTCKANE